MEMESVRAILPQANICSHIRPSRCSRGGGGILHRHGEIGKHVMDMGELLAA